MSAALLAVVAVTLLGAGVAHVLHQEDLRASLLAHAVLPTALHGIAGRILPLVEVGTGLLLLVLLGLGSVLTSGAALLAAALLAAMTVYVHVAARRTAGTGIPCGCGLGEAPLGLWVTVRAGLLAALAAVGGLTVGTGPALAGAPAEIAVAAAATLALAIGISLLPQARADLSEAIR